MTKIEFRYRLLRVARSACCASPLLANNTVLRRTAPTTSTFSNRIQCSSRLTKRPPRFPAKGFSGGSTMRIQNQPSSCRKLPSGCSIIRAPSSRSPNNPSLDSGAIHSFGTPCRRSGSLLFTPIRSSAQAECRERTSRLRSMAGSTASRSTWTRQFGTEDEYKQMVKTAQDHGAIVGSDLVPLHTGSWRGFLLAERAYKQYPGMYTIVEIPQNLGICCLSSVNLRVTNSFRSMQPYSSGIWDISPGTIHSADADPSRRPPGAVGAPRLRWLVSTARRAGGSISTYSSLAKPVLNWLDPSLAGPRSQYGDAARHIVGRGTTFLRLDAVPFTAVDPDTNDTMAQTYLQPLSVDNGNDLAYIARKLGGFTYQELFVPPEQLKTYTKNGPDLSVRLLHSRPEPCSFDHGRCIGIAARTLRAPAERRSGGHAGA